METLRVPKNPCPVIVALPGGEARPVSLFLAEFAGHQPRRERITDLLNGPRHFLPVFDEKVGAITLLNRSTIAWIRVPPELDPDPTCTHTLPDEHPVELTFSDGTTMQGNMCFLRPNGRSRLTDFLNEPIPFFRLLDSEGMVLVNRRHVALVTPQGET